MLIPLTAPTTGVLTLAQAKAQLKVQHDQHDELIRDYVASASAFVAQQSELVLQPTSLEERLDCWPSGRVTLAAGPVREVEGVSYLDVNGDVVTIAESDFRWEPTRSSAEVWLLSTFTHPALQTETRGAVRIQYVAGFNDINAPPGDARLQLPPPARQAVRMLVDHWYSNRGVIAFGEVLANIPLSVDTLIDSFRAWRV